MAAKSIALKIFIGLAAGMFVIGTGSGVAAITYYKTDAKKEHPIIAKNLAESMSIKEFSAQQNIKYRWISDCQFSIATKAFDKESDGYVTKDNLVTFDKKNKTFTFESVCNGEMTLVSDFDSTINYTVNFTTKFKSADVENLLKKQYSEFFDDGVVTRQELKSVTALDIITEDIETVNVDDFSFLTSLKSVRLNGQGKILTLTNNKAPSTTKFYVPKGEYNQYVALESWQDRENNVFTNVGSIEEYACVMLFKNGGLVDKSENRLNYECFEIKKGTTFDDLPNASSIISIGRNFMGWKDKDGNEYGRSTVINDDIKLYANWEDKIYRVKYHIQDGISETIVKPFKYGDDLKIIQNSEFASEDEQYVFLGWSLSSESLRIDYTENTIIPNFFDDSIQEMDLWAVWTLKSFDILILNSNDELVKTINCTYGSSITVPEIAGLGEYTGITRTPNSSAVEYEPGETISITFNPEATHGYLYLPRSSGETNIVFYCVFKPLHYKVNYILNNNTIHTQEYIIDGQETSGLLDKHTNVQLLTNQNFTNEQIEKVGYHFVGWIREYQGEKTLFTNSTPNTIPSVNNIVIISSWNYQEGFDGKSDINLTPYYEADKLVINFVKGGASSVYSSMTVSYDVKATRSFSGSASYPGRYVDNVYCDEFSPKVTLNSKTAITVSEIQSLYQKAYTASTYTRPSKVTGHSLTVNLSIGWAMYNYTVTYYDGTTSLGSVTEKHYGDKIPNPGNPEKDGYTFAGWFYDTDFTRSVNFSSDTITSDVSIYAKFDKNSSGGGGNTSTKCVAAGTMITMANGLTRPVEELSIGDKVLTWDFFTGQFVSSELILVEAMPDYKYTIDLTFENGVVFRALSSHGFYSTDRKAFVEMFPYNAEEFIGESFWFVDGPSKLVSVEVGQEYTTCYGLITANTLTCIGNGALNCVSQVVTLMNLAEIDDDMRYDATDLANNLALYGEATYADFSNLVSEDMFNAFNGQYVNIAFGRNGLTIEELIRIVNMFYEGGGQL